MNSTKSFQKTNFLKCILKEDFLVICLPKKINEKTLLNAINVALGNLMIKKNVSTNITIGILQKMALVAIVIKGITNIPRLFSSLNKLHDNLLINIS